MPENTKFGTSRAKEKHKISSWRPEKGGVRLFTVGDEDKNAVKTFGLSLPAVPVIIRPTC